MGQGLILHFICNNITFQPPGGTVKKSELLPSGWNENQELYSLLYQNVTEETFVLKIISVDGTLLVHVLVGIVNNFCKCVKKKCKLNFLFNR